MIIINFKNYVTGKKALALAKLIEKYIPKAIVAVPSVDIQTISSKTKLTVFAQHIDAVEGRATGFFLAESAKAAGAKGTLLNHSEHQLPKKELAKAVEKSKKARLKVVICAPTLIKAKELTKLKPEAIAFEDKKLIGTKKSITRYMTKEVQQFANMINKSSRKTKPLCGAGINSIEDVESAEALGCEGVLIASAIAKAPRKNAEAFLKRLSKS